MKSNIFPYETIWPAQEGIAEAVENTILGGGVGFIEAPTGIGKTVAIVSSILGSGKKIIYLTANEGVRDAPILEVLKINQKLQRYNIVDLRAKGRMCLYIKKNFRYSDCEVLNERKTCPYFFTADGNKEDLVHRVFSSFMWEVKNSPGKFVNNKKAILFSEFGRTCEKEKVCFYKTMKVGFSLGDLIVLDYNWVFIPTIFDVLKKSLSNLKDYVLVIDEADILHSRLLNGDLISANLSVGQTTRFSDMVNQMIKAELLNKDTSKFADDYCDCALKTIKDALIKKVLDPTTLIHSFVKVLGKNFIIDLEKIISLSRETENTENPVRPDKFFRMLENLDKERFFVTKTTIEEDGDEKKMRREAIKILPYELAGIRFGNQTISEIFGMFGGVVFFSATLGSPESFAQLLGIPVPRKENCFYDSKTKTEKYRIVIHKGVTNRKQMRETNREKFYEIAELMRHHEDSLLYGAVNKAECGLTLERFSDSRRLYDMSGDEKTGMFVGSSQFNTKGGRGTNCAVHIKSVLVAGLPYPNYDFVFKTRMEFLKRKYGDKTAQVQMSLQAVHATAQFAGRIFRDIYEKPCFVVLADERYNHDYHFAKVGCPSFYMDNLPLFWKEHMRFVKDNKELQKELQEFFINGKGVRNGEALMRWKNEAR